MTGDGPAATMPRGVSAVTMTGDDPAAMTGDDPAATVTPHSTRAAALAALATVVVALAALAASGPAVGAASSNATFSLVQGDRCTPLETFGNGSTGVATFYDYRNGSTDPTGLYSSYGTRDFQAHQTSVLFLYNGSEGVSLVFLHDQLGDDPGGGAVTFTVTGLPENGTWVVEDDTYPDRDDNFTHEGSRSVVDWMWAPDRTDGAAFRGVDRDGITITPDFDATPTWWNDSGVWTEWPYADDPVADWVAYTGDGTVSLNRTRNVTVRRQPCDVPPPTAAISVRPSVADVNATNVTLDAGNATAEAEISRYEWDFDGDGVTEATTTNATVTHVYPTEGEYEATVAVVDAQGRTDAANATVNVTDRVAPSPAASVPTTAAPNATVAVAAAGTTDNDAVANVTWRFEDGPTVAGRTANHSYGSVGTYDVTLEVADPSGNVATLTTTVTVLRPVGNFSAVPTDPDGDGRAEDANGDGELSVVDVQAVFANRDGPTFEEYPHLFDYNGDGEVDVVDVQALFAEATDDG